MSRTVIVLALGAALLSTACISPRVPRASRATVEERVQLTAQLIEVWEQALTSAEARFAHGTAPESEVNEARAALIEARLRHNHAKAALETLDD